MDFTKIRQASLKAFLAFLILTSLIAVVSVLHGEFGEIQGKIMATTVTISAASICSMSCAAFIERRRKTRLGLCGIVFSICAALLLIIGLWPDIDSEVFWKTTGSCGVLALAFAHAFLLLLPELDAGQKWVQRASWISIAVLAILIIVAIWSEYDSDIYGRVMAVAGIVVGLETLSIPVLLMLKKPAGRKGERLVLERVEDDLFEDRDGKRYRLQEIDSELMQ